MKRYQDYVIKDGKFIGEFEEMYQQFTDPWHQIESLSQSYSRWDTLLTLKRYNISSVLEVGCGLGAFTNLMSQFIKGINLLGIDISETAVNRARELYPALQFEVGNIAEFSTKKDRWGNYDAIIFSEVMWYILDDLSNILDNIKNNYKGYLIINQVFYKGEQSYGTEYFTNLDEMIQYLDLPLLFKAEYNKLSENSIETHSVYKIE